MSEPRQATLFGHDRRMVRATLGTLVLNGSTLAINFVLALVLARELGTGGFGAYAFAVACATFLSVPASLGLTPLVVRHVAGYNEREEWGLLRGLIRRANQAVAATSFVLVLVAAGVGWALHDSHPKLAGPFLIGLLLVPIIALTMLRQAAMQGLNRVVLGRIPDTLALPGTFLVLILVARYARGDAFNARWATALHVTAAAGAFLLGAAMLRAVLPRGVRETPPEYAQRAWTRSALPMLAFGVLLVVNGQVGTILLGPLSSADAAGVFNVASRAAAFTSFLYLAATYPLSPNVARLWALGDMASLQRVLTRTGRVVLVVSCLVALLFFVFGEQLLAVFGGDFTGGVTALRLLVLAELVKVAVGFGGVALLMTRYEASMTRAMTLGVVVNVALTAGLAPLWGATGAACGALASALLTSAYISILVWRRLGIYAPAIGRAPPRWAVGGVPGSGA